MGGVLNRGILCRLARGFVERPVGPLDKNESPGSGRKSLLRRCRRRGRRESSARPRSGRAWGDWDRGRGFVDRLVGPVDKTESLDTGRESPRCRCRGRRGAEDCREAAKRGVPLRRPLRSPWGLIDRQVHGAQICEPPFSLSSMFNLFRPKDCLPSSPAPCRAGSLTCMRLNTPRYAAPSPCRAGSSIFMWCIILYIKYT